MSLKLYLEIAMTSVVWLLVVPVTFVAYMVVKDCGWYVYRRIGPELRLQSKFNRSGATGLLELTERNA